MRSVLERGVLPGARAKVNQMLFDLRTKIYCSFPPKSRKWKKTDPIRTPYVLVLFNLPTAETTFVQITGSQRSFENHLDPVVLVFKWLALIENPDEYCQGFSDFSRFLHYFVLAKLATNSMRVKVFYWNSKGARISKITSGRM